MAILSDNPYLAGTDPMWLQIWKQFNPDDASVGGPKGAGLSSLLGDDMPTLRLVTTDKDILGRDTTTDKTATDTSDGATTRVGTYTPTPPATGVGGSVGFPGRGGTHYPAVVASGPEFIAPGAPGNPSNVTFVRPQLPDPNDQFKTHYGTAAPIYWDPTDVTGGTMGSAGTFVPTGGPVHGLGKALGLSTKGWDAVAGSAWDMPADYVKALKEGGQAAAVDYLQSGPRGADGLTDAQRHFVNQVTLRNRQSAAPGANMFQDYLNALGASQAPPGTTVGPSFITGGGRGGGSGNAMRAPDGSGVTVRRVAAGLGANASDMTDSRKLSAFFRSKGYVYAPGGVTADMRQRNPGKKFLNDRGQVI